MKEAQKQRKDAKLIKQLEKQKEQEAAEREKLEQKQNNKGKTTTFSQSSRIPLACCNVRLLCESQTGRAHTISVALPGSVLDNAQSPELRTYLAGQIARACVVFCVDEIVVFDEQGGDSK